jgi:hypothetical protein
MNFLKKRLSLEQGSVLEAVNALSKLDRVFRSPVEPIGFEDARAILVVKPRISPGLKFLDLAPTPETCGGKRMPDDGGPF